MLEFKQRVCSKKEDEKLIELIAGETGLRREAALIMWQRGITSIGEAKKFLSPDESHIHDPYFLPDMKAAVERIKRAIDEGEIVTVFCDYDADGTCGGSVLYLHLKSMGLSVHIMTPNRHKEGYGLSETAVKSIDENDSTLIITVDCGITNINEVELALSLGIDVIVTDHHECGEQLPNTPYVVNPKRKDSEYPCSFIAGCGVAFKLIQALSGLEAAMKYIDLVAIGTVTDIVPLKDENRALVYLGIEKLKTSPSAGVEALSRIGGIRVNSAMGVSFGLGPRINAAGRMDTAQLAIDILSAIRSSPELDEKAKQLCRLNEQRRKEVDDITESAMDMVLKSEYMNDSAILLADENWNTGVIGIAAAKIAEKFLRPCVLFGGAEGNLVGSARSIDGINMYEVLAAFSDGYEKFGGHSQAAGLTIKPEMLDELRQNVCRYIEEHYDESVFVQTTEYDLELEVSEITDKLITDIDRLEPFGHENLKPHILIRDANIKSPKFIGKEKNHLKFSMSKKGSETESLNFFFKSDYTLLPGKGDFVCEASINDYNSKPQLIIRQLNMHYDKKLKNSYVDVNKAKMTKQFIDEVSMLELRKENGVPNITEEEFTKEIQMRMKQSRFSMCIAAGTRPAFERLVGINAVKDVLVSGELLLHDTKNYRSDNCISINPAAGHSDFYYIGVLGFFDDKLRKEYIKYGKDFFTQRKHLLGFYKIMTQFLSKGPRTMQEIVKNAAEGYERTAFALRVFKELELIGVDKSGKIFAIESRGEKRELTQSRCYKSFAALLERN